MSKKLLLAAAILALPAAANAQSDWFAPTQPTYQGFYIGAQGGLNWLLNNQSYVMLCGKLVQTRLDVAAIRVGPQLAGGDECPLEGPTDCCSGRRFSDVDI